MSRWRRIAGVGLVAVSVVVQGLDGVGRWHFDAVAKQLARQPDAGAEELATSAWLELPSAIDRSRRLVSSDLRGADDQLIIAALEAVSRRQIRWLPTDPAGYKNRSRAELLQGRLDEGAEALADALRRDPTSAYLRRLHGLVLWEGGRLAACLDELAEAAGLAPGYDHPQVDLVPEDQHWVKLEGLRRRLRLYPRQRLEGLLALAGELRKQGKPDAAEELLAGDQEHPKAALKLAEWDLDDGFPERAVSRLQQLLDRHGLPASVRTSAWSRLAEALDLSGDAESAVAAAERAVQLAPGSSAPYLALAGIALRRGDTEAGLAHLRRARGLDPSNPNLLVRLASVAAAAGHPQEARMALRRAVEIAPDRADLPARQVAFLLGEGDFAEAALALSDALDRHPTDPKLIALVDRLRREVAR